LGTQKITEYGAIEIKLENLDEESRTSVIQARKPLGAILNDSKVPYSSTPRAFLKVVPDNQLIDVFGSVEADYLFGRSYEISSYSGDTLARIVEILPTI
jgi:chorismate-pyruvate lyase